MVPNEDLDFLAGLQAHVLLYEESASSACALPLS